MYNGVELQTWHPLPKGVTEAVFASSVELVFPDAVIKKVLFMKIGDSENHYYRITIGNTSVMEVFKQLAALKMSLPTVEFSVHHSDL